MAIGSRSVFASIRLQQPLRGSQGLRQQVHGITGLVAHTDSHVHLVVAIDGGLGVVALNPAVTAFEDVAVWIGEIPLGLGLGETGGIGGKLPQRHRQWIGRR
jgi:hypothetical protein